MNCKICNKETDIIFNINLDPIPICNNCAIKITTQQLWNMFGSEFQVKQNNIERCKYCLGNHPVP